MMWLNPGRWLAVLLFLVLIYIGHSLDKQRAVKQAIAIERAEQTALALEASESYRAKEKTLTANIEKVKKDYANEKARRDVSSRALDDGLRNFETANSGGPGSDSVRPSGANGTGGLESELLGHCARTLAGLAKTADRLEAKVVGLQAYIESIK